MNIAGPFRDSGLPTFSWATKPDATKYPRAQIHISDIGVGGGTVFFSNGTRWRPLNHACILSELSVAVATMEVTEDLMAETRIPAGLLQNDDILRMTFAIGKTGTVESVTFRNRLGDTEGVLGTQLFSTANPSGSNKSYSNLFEYQRKSATGFLRRGNALLTPFSGAGVATHAITPVTVPSMDADTFFQVTCFVGAGLEAITLLPYTLELISAGA